MRDQPRLRRRHGMDQAKRAVGIGVVAGDHMVGQKAKRLHVTPGSEILEGADADMAGGDAGQDRAGQGGFAPDRLPRRDGGQRAGGGHAKRRHRLGHQVFADHRPDGRAPVAPARKRRRAGALELKVKA